MIFLELCLVIPQVSTGLRPGEPPRTVAALDKVASERSPALAHAVAHMAGAAHPKDIKKYFF